MPFDRTVGAYIERKQAIATDLTTREMQELSCQIRERAFWSATVNNAKVVNTMQRACADFAKGNLSMSDARLAIQKALAIDNNAPVTFKSYVSSVYVTKAH